MPSLRYNYICVSLAWFNKLKVHRFQDTSVTLHYGFGRTVAFQDIAVDDTNQAVVGIGIHEYLEIIDGAIPEEEVKAREALDGLREIFNQ